MTRQSSRRWALPGGVLCLGLLASGPTTAFADPFDWEAARQVQTTRFPQSAHHIEIELGVADGDGDLELRARWDADGEAHQATLMRTMCDDSRWWIWVAADETLEVQHGPCSRYDDHQLLVTHSWRFDPTEGFVDVTTREHSPYALGREAIRQALADGHIDEAWDALNAIGTTPNGGHTDDSREIFQEFFDGVFVTTQRLGEEGDVQRGAELVRGLFRRGILMECVEDPDAFTIPANVDFGDCTFNQLAATDENRARLEQTAELLERAGDAATAEVIRGALRGE